MPDSSPVPTTAPNILGSIPPGRIRPILEFVASQYGLTAKEIIELNRTPKYCYPRHLGMYLATELTACSSMQIGKVFKRDNSTVRHVRRKIARLLQNDPEIAEDVQTLRVNYYRGRI